MYLLLYIALIAFGFFCRKSKYFSIFVIVFVALIVYMHPKCPDYANYNNVYKYIAFH